MADFKLDMFQQVLPALDDHNFEFLSRQSDEARKSFAAPVVLRWASAIRGPYADLMLMLVNTRVNQDFFDLSGDPDLQWRLLASCGLGVQPRHEWIAMPARTRSKSAISDFLARYWPEANSEEIALILNQFTRESFIQFLRDCGLSPSEEETTLHAYDRFYGHVSKKKASKKKR